MLDVLRMHARDAPVSSLDHHPHVTYCPHTLVISSSINRFLPQRWALAGKLGVSPWQFWTEMQKGSFGGGDVALCGAFL